MCVCVCVFNDPKDKAHMVLLLPSVPCTCHEVLVSAQAQKRKGRLEGDSQCPAKTDEF